MSGSKIRTRLRELGSKSCVKLRLDHTLPANHRFQGTWRFISAGLLDDIPEPRQHLLRDDLESFAHVLIYHVLRYRPTVVGEHAKRRLRDNMRDVFELEDIQEVVAGKADAFTVQVTLLICPT